MHCDSAYSVKQMCRDLGQLAWYKVSWKVCKAGATMKWYQLDTPTKRPVEKQQICCLDQTQIGSVHHDL